MFFAIEDGLARRVPQVYVRTPRQSGHQVSVFFPTQKSLAEKHDSSKCHWGLQGNPVNQDALGHPSLESETLSKETDLPFIPLYSPASRLTNPRHSNKDTLCSSNREGNSEDTFYDSSTLYSPTRLHEDGFTEKEISLFETRYENGHDVPGDDRYRQWLSRTHPENTVWIQPLGCGSTAVSQFLSYPSPPSQIPIFHPKSCGRVLTSTENLQIMEEK